METAKSEVSERDIPAYYLKGMTIDLNYVDLKVIPAVEFDSA